MSRSIACLFGVFFASLLSASAAQTSPAAELTSKLHWRNIGPFVGGRVVAVAGVPSRPDLFYMGAVQGGIWKSSNYGQTWDNISDGKIPGTADSIGALAVAPSNPNVIYAGTGEADVRQDFDTGAGVYRSPDAGKTWHYAGLRDTHMTTSLAIDPRNPDIVYATSLGHVFQPNSERGVFKTLDGGKHWRRSLFVDDRTGANVVVMDPHNPNTLYAAMWQVQRTPWTLTSGGPGSGLYKTVDGGAHWRKISTNPGFAGGVLGKISVSVSGSDPGSIYAIVQAHDGGVYRSTDGGATWKHVNAEWKLRQRAFYYTAIFADPVNRNVAYAPQVDGVFKTTDGGKTWHPISSAGDHHIIWINPHNTKILLEGDDGGATVSVDGGKTWSSEGNQPTGQFYHIAIDDRFPFHVFGAQQDEGAYEGPSADYEGLGPAVWHQVAWGESTYVARQPDDPNVTYGSGYFTFLSRYDNVTGENKNVSPWPLYPSGSAAGAMKYRFGWTHPIFFSPANPKELLTAAQVVFKSEDNGETWSVISPDLTRNDKRTEGPSGGPVDFDQTGAETYPFVSSLAVSPVDGTVIWAGSSDGLVHLTTDGGLSWHPVTPPALMQWADITSIEPSLRDRGTAYVTASRYQWDDFHPYIFKTADYGLHWTELTNGIPADQYVFAVRQDPRLPNLVFAGTRSTVYVSYDSGYRWQPLTLDLPGVQVRDIAVDAPEGEVAIATHGRAFWILDNLALLEQIASEPYANPKSVQLFSPETAWLTHAYGASGGSDSGENPDYGTAVFFNVPPDYNEKTPVTLSFFDAAGHTIRSFDLHLRGEHERKPSDEELGAMDDVRQTAYGLQDLTAIDRGMNLFQWNMRYPPATEVNGYHAPTTDDMSDAVQGPTIVPGTYTVVLRYGKLTMQKQFRVELDPRLHPAPDALAARLALATQIHQSIDTLDRAINAAMRGRAQLPAEKRAELDALMKGLLPMQIRSTEGDSLYQVGLHDYLAFLMNELDLAYQAPTPAEYSTYERLRGQADSAVLQLGRLVPSASSLH